MAEALPRSSRRKAAMWAHIGAQASSSAKPIHAAGPVPRIASRTGHAGTGIDTSTLAPRRSSGLGGRAASLHEATSRSQRQGEAPCTSSTCGGRKRADERRFCSACRVCVWPLLPDRAAKVLGATLADWRRYFNRRLGPRDEASPPTFERTTAPSADHRGASGLMLAL